MLLSAPLLLPMAQAFKIDMVHFGVVMTANLCHRAVHAARGRDIVRRGQPRRGGDRGHQQAPDPPDDGDGL